MNRNLLIVFMLLFFGAKLQAQSRLDSVRQMLEDGPVQEKVYLHLDNTCYFKGDTIWYKAYLVRADDFTYSDMSRILYVELLSPDGMLVERQQIIASEDGYSDGNFALQDSIYSGFYEVRAYTRWMLNFCVSEHEFGSKDFHCFYNLQMAKDFFRQFDAVYSRVVPVYERPETAGDYSSKYIVSRPKTRLEKEQKEKLMVNFYPEGGHLIAGQKCTVAFEATDEDGEQQDVSGRVKVADRDITISTTHQGRGVFTVDVPEDHRLTASFHWHNKDYTFDLPKAEKAGCALRLDAVGDNLVANISLSGLLAGREYGVAVLCRGVLKHFETITGSTALTLDKAELPTGVNNLLVIDESGQLLADRLFFVNHHDYGQQSIVIDEDKKTYEPFEQITLNFRAPADADHISIAVRDGATDEPSYDTGNMLTDLLLSSELKGFVPYPDYYFEADDREHRQHLDLLLMVQGWRRYDYRELASGQPLRYEPEQTMTVEGTVHPMVDVNEYMPDEVRYWAVGVFGYSPSRTGEIEGPPYQLKEMQARVGIVGETFTESSGDEGGDDSSSSSESASESPGQPSWLLYDNGTFNVIGASDDPNTFEVYGDLKHEVTVEGELVLGADVATVKMETDNGGHFAFNVPPYYGDAILFLKAYDTDISDKKLRRLERKGFLDEEAIPEYYVKRELFYPVFAKKYSFYQCHLPQEQDDFLADDGSLLPEVERLSKMDTQLRNVNVKGRRRRGRQRIDYSKPACVYDAQDLYNLVTDRGLSFGTFMPREFPFQVSMALLGNYNSKRKMNVMARQNDGMFTPYVYYRNYDPGKVAQSQFRSDFLINRDMKLNRQDEIRLYTDFELRNEDKRVEQQVNTADVTLDFMLVADEGKRYTYRDRRLILKGMYEPDDFYHPDYSHRPLPKTVKDYRRTLYWNPNASLDDDGCFKAIFYNNGKQTRIKVSAAGLTSEGTPIYNNQ